MKTSAKEIFEESIIDWNTGANVGVPAAVTFASGGRVVLTSNVDGRDVIFEGYEQSPGQLRLGITIDRDYLELDRTEENPSMFRGMWHEKATGVDRPLTLLLGTASDSINSVN